MLVASMSWVTILSFRFAKFSVDLPVMTVLRVFPALFVAVSIFQASSSCPPACKKLGAECGLFNGSCCGEFPLRYFAGTKTIQPPWFYEMFSICHKISTKGTG